MIMAPQCLCLAYSPVLPRLCDASLAQSNWQSVHLTEPTFLADAAHTPQFCRGRLAVSWGAMIAIKRACQVALIAAVAWPTGWTRACAFAPKTPVGV